MIKRLKRRFVIIATAAVAVVLFIMLGGINIANYTSVVSSADKMLRVIADNGGRMPVPAKPTGKDWPRDQSFNPETPFETRFFTVITDAAGEAYAYDLGSIAAVGTEQAAQYARSAVTSGRSSGFIGVYRYLVTETYSGRMVVFLDSNRGISSFFSFLKSSAVVAAVGILAVFLILLLVSGRVIKPIADSYKRQRRFITDASHELKTPLTVIDANAEVLEMTDGENQWTKSIKNQVSRLSDLTCRLVALSRMDEEDNRLMISDFSLSDAINESVEPFCAIAAGGKKNLDVSIEKNVTYGGNDESIRQLVGILLENAVKYSDQYSTITLTMKTKGKSPVLTVKNRSSGIKKGRHDQFFERFYRADDSRSSVTGGFGIGLSIAKAIVSAHKGKITAYSPKDDELVITVTL